MSKPEADESATASKKRDADAEDDDAKRPSTGKLVLVTLALLLVLEVTARIAYSVHYGNQDAEFAKQYPPNTYIRSFTAKQDYRFVNLFTMNPERGAGPEFRFDSMGFRLDKRSLRFDQSQGQDGFKHIWMIGSSTTQGGGLREGETIAAQLNDLLEAEGSKWRVLNLGQGGYSSTQELLLFLELIRSGFRPDAIFTYDGGNESPFPGPIAKNGTPGWEKTSLNARVLLDVQGGESAAALTSLALTRLTKIDDLMTSILARLHPAPASSGPPGEKPDRGGTSIPGDDWDGAARHYLTNLNLIRSAAEFAGAPAAFFFQPLMQYEDHYKLRTYSDYETSKLVGQMANNEYKRREALKKPELDALRSKLGLRDLHDVFRGHDGETLWGDPRHTNGKANALVAARILQELRPILATLPLAPSPSPPPPASPAPPSPRD